MGGSASAPPPPDTSRFSDQSVADANQSREWAQTMWDQGQQQWGELQQWSQDFMGQAMPAMEESFSWAREQRDRFNEYVMPQMQSLFSDAETYASKAEEDRQRGTAIQDVKSATEAQRASQLRKLESYGVDPSETRYKALDKTAGIAEAGMSAMAANQAGERTKQIGRGLRADAINVGTGFLNDARQSAQLGTNIGAGGLNAAGGAATSGAMAAQSALPYMQQASSSNAQGAGIVDTSYGREIDYAEDQRAADAADNQMWSDAIGGGMNMLSGGITGMVGTAAGGNKALGFMGGMAEGGPVAAPGGPTDDLGAITISDGEYVIPADVVMRLGTNYFDKMIEKETGRPPPQGKQAIPVQGGQ